MAICIGVLLALTVGCKFSPTRNDSHGSKDSGLEADAEGNKPHPSGQASGPGDGAQCTAACVDQLVLDFPTGIPKDTAVWFYAAGDQYFQMVQGCGEKDSCGSGKQLTLTLPAVDANSAPFDSIVVGYPTPKDRYWLRFAEMTPSTASICGMTCKVFKAEIPQKDAGSYYCGTGDDGSGDGGPDDHMTEMEKTAVCDDVSDRCDGRPVVYDPPCGDGNCDQNAEIHWQCE
jgi:hypothetical protein